MTRLAIHLSLITSYLLAAKAACAQGSLIPPGAPMATMKSLDQIEARTPISSAPYTISSSGSYYLTNNLNVAAGDAITIAANGVTLDLNGFTVSSTAPNGTGTAITLNSGLTDIAIFNGHIKGGITYSNGSYTGSGFLDGISYIQSQPRNVRITGVSVSGCRGSGIQAGVDSSIVESCLVQVIGGQGITATVVSNSRAYLCGLTAISATSAANCSAYSTGNTAISARTALNCEGTSLTGKGIHSTGVATNCYGYSFGNDPNNSTGLQATAATNCYGQSSGGIGMFVSHATNCQGVSSGATGLFALITADGSRGTSVGAVGLSAGQATNCRGDTDGPTADGLSASTARGCYGSASFGTGRGINAVTASDSQGYSNSGSGLLAENAANCRGQSTSGFGLEATRMAYGCYGETFSGGAGLRCVGVASYCSGLRSAAGGTAINCAVAIGCNTFGGTIVAPGGKFLGTP